jgi:hypothetical protein
MTLRPLAAALLMLAALGLAACGGDDEPSASASSSSTSEEDEARDAQVKFAQCMRENGVDLPDPEPGEKGPRIRVGPGSDIDPEEFEAAAKECEEFRSDIRPQLSEGEQEEFKQNALEFARCMRENGVDMPDPQFQDGGGVRIGGPGINPEDPDFQKAQEECGDLMGGAGRQP